MHNSYTRNSVNLFCTKITFALFLALIIAFSSISPAQAQLKVRARKPGDLHNKQVSSFRKGESRQKNPADRKFSYGFFVGLHSARLTARPESSAVDTSFVVIQPQFTMGFALGFLTTYRISSRWELRFQPGAGFYEYNLDYQYQNNLTAQDTTLTKVVESTMLELPLMIKYRSQLRNGKGMYLTAGIKPALSISSQTAADEQNLRIGTADMSIEYGFGFDLNYQYFKLSPEIRFSHGILNRAIQDNNFFARSTKRLTSHSISIIFNFGNRDPELVR